jgi:hypothetical protein
VPSVEAVISAVGLLLNSLAETVQSIAFLSVPGTPCAYSGVQIITAVAVEINCLKAITFWETFSLLASGLKCGSSAIPSKIVISNLSYVNSAIALIKFKLVEFALVLPQMATIFFL